MTAQDYYNRYAMVQMFTPMTIAQILQEFNAEARSLCEAIGATSNEAVTAVLREQNIKWNGLSRVLAEKRGGLPPILEDGFKRFWLQKLPGLAEFWV